MFFSPDLVNARVRSIRLLVSDGNSINLGTQANHQPGQLSNLGHPKIRPQTGNSEAEDSSAVT